MKYIVNFISLLGVLHYYNLNPYLFGLCSGVLLTTLIMILKEVKHDQKE